jgi:hypothetical protein
LGILRETLRYNKGIIYVSEKLKDKNIMCLSLRFSGYNRLKDVTGCGCDEKSLDVLERFGAIL